jgi:transposase
LGNPLRFILSPGQQSDYKQALNLITGFHAGAVLADRGYDADSIVHAIHSTGAQAVIPSKKNRKQPRSYDAWLYKERNLVERLFNKLKNFRRVATRYDKTDLAYSSFLYLAGIYLWLK